MNENSPELKQFIRDHSYFWWWVPESAKENVNLNSVVEATLNYGTLEDIKKLFEIAGIKKVAEIFYQDTNRERINYFPMIKNYFELYFKKYA
ncbi:MAG: hypothetical protein HY738_20860 [Bacteroidia bacterium]|nr:hypothetical protein [Bacteroidia bacterium]